MSDSKIKIDLSQGIFEVEGNEEFVKEIYSEYKNKLNALQKVQKATRRRISNERGDGPTNTRAKKPRKAGAAGTAPSLVKDLDLSAKDGKPRLKDFYNTYKASPNLMKNLIFCYYLHHIKGIQPISTNHVFTCYRAIGVKTPKALEQSLWDTSHLKGWIDTSSLLDIKVTISGMNYIEHDMPKAESET